MLLLSCTTLSDPLELCYNPSLTKINFHRVKQLIQNIVTPSYDEETVEFLKILLKENPYERPTLMEIYEKYNHKMNP